MSGGAPIAPLLIHKPWTLLSVLSSRRFSEPVAFHVSRFRLVVTGSQLGENFLGIFTMTLRPFDSERFRKLIG